MLTDIFTQFLPFNCENVVVPWWKFHNGIYHIQHTNSLFIFGFSFKIVQDPYVSIHYFIHSLVFFARNHTLAFSISLFFQWKSYDSIHLFLGFFDGYYMLAFGISCISWLFSMKTIQ